MWHNSACARSKNLLSSLKMPPYIAHIVTPSVTALTTIILLLPMCCVRCVNTQFDGYWLGYLIFAALIIFTVTYICQRIVERAFIYNHVRDQEEHLMRARAAAGLQNQEALFSF